MIKPDQDNLAEVWQEGMRFQGSARNLATLAKDSRVRIVRFNSTGFSVNITAFDLPPLIQKPPGSDIYIVVSGVNSKDGSSLLLEINTIMQNMHYPRTRLEFAAHPRDRKSDSWTFAPPRDSKVSIQHHLNSESYSLSPAGQDLVKIETKIRQGFSLFNLALENADKAINEAISHMNVRR